MKIALIGYGKMGQAIEELAIAKGHTISHRIGTSNQGELENISPASTDVAIEFSRPDAAPANVGYCLTAGVPVVCGTTGWAEQKATMEKLCQQKEGAFFWASNFSIGVNLFFQLNRFLAKLMENAPAYNVRMEEVHHVHKKDAPSGTAITLAEGILAELSRKNKWVNELIEDAKALPIVSKREDEVPGTHTVEWYSETDVLEIKHTAHSRKGFAAGALAVAEWLPGRKGVFGMDDFLSLQAASPESR